MISQFSEAVTAGVLFSSCLISCDYPEHSKTAKSNSALYFGWVFELGKLPSEYVLLFDVQSS